MGDEIDIVILCPLNQSEDLRLAVQECQLPSRTISERRFDGVTEIGTLMVAVSAVALPLLLKAIVAKLKQAEKVHITFNGITIRGVSEEKIPQIVESIVKAKQRLQKK